MARRSRGLPLPEPILQRLVVEVIRIANSKEELARVIDIVMAVSRENHVFAASVERLCNALGEAARRAVAPGKTRPED
jgi:hypothetical protein